MTNRMREALQLQDCLGRVIYRERECLNEILDLIIKAETSRAFLELGYSSLLDWLVQHFNYSTTAALRRIASARLKRAVPALHEKIQSGAVNLTTAAKTQSAIRAEETRTARKISDDVKQSLIEKIEGKSGDQAERILMMEFPEAQIFQREKVKITSAEEVTLQIVMSRDEYEVFSRTKQLLSHSVPNGSPGKVVAILCRDYNSRKIRTSKTSRASQVKKVTSRRASVCANENGGSWKDSGLAATASTPRLAMEIATAMKSTSAADSILELEHQLELKPQLELKFAVEPMAASKSKSASALKTAAEINRKSFDRACLFEPSAILERTNRHIPKANRNLVLERDQRACQFKNFETGKTCGSRYQIEIDHIKPFAMGGSHEVENLRCLCAQHNRYRAVRTFGTRQEFFQNFSRRAKDLRA